MKAGFSNNPNSFRDFFRNKTKVRCPGKVLIDNNTYEFNFYDLLDNSIILHSERNIKLTLIFF